MSIVEVKIPQAGESITEVTIAEWFKQTGDYVALDEEICELESDKANMELPAEVAGQLEVLIEEGEDVEVGQVIAKIDTSVEAPVSVSTPKEEVPEQEEKPATQVKETPATAATNAATSSAAEKKIPSPAAAKIMKEQNIAAQVVSGTGKDGRITKQDVLAFMANGYGAGAAQQLFSREERKEKMSRLRRTIAKRLVAAKNETAMLTTFNEVDMTAIMEARKMYKEKFKESHGVNLGFMSFFTRACCLALQEFPAVNAYIDNDQNIEFHDFCDISIAVSTPKGLVVPVIRNAESLSMAGIEAKVKELAIKGRDGELSIEEMEGGTFTITNGGVFGSLMSTPIINQPQSAILGMHKIQERPMAIDGKVEIRPMMYVALSYDHRIIDGKESVSFLVSVKDKLENPERLLVGKDPLDILLDL